jgi:hypothetical protein
MVSYNFENILCWKPSCILLFTINKPAYIRPWSNVFRHWARCSRMEHDKINFKVFKWSIKKANGRIKNWSYRICEADLATALAIN